MNKPIYKLKDWIDESKLDIYSLNLNPLAIDYLKDNPDKIVWSLLSLNENAVELLIDIKNRDKITWSCLSKNENDEIVNLILKDENINKLNLYMLNNNNNPKIIEYLIKPENFHKIQFDKFLGNFYSAKYILENKNLFIDNYYFTYICNNPNPILIDLFKKNFNKLNWYLISRNPLLMDIIKDLDENEYINKIDWVSLSLNRDIRAITFLYKYPSKINKFNLLLNPTAIQIMIKNKEKIDSFIYISGFPEAIDILKENQNKINWNLFSKNPAIFELDYKKMRKNFELIEEEILKEVLKPKRVFKYLELYNFDIDDMFD